MRFLLVLAKLITARPEHVPAIAEAIRDPDRREIWASSMSKPERVLLSGLRYSDFVMTGMADDVPVCMWGVVQESLVGNVGVPWMIGTKHLDALAVTFLRRCREPLLQVLKRYDRLVNYVDARNTRTIKWLTFMGFKVDKDPVPYGVFNLPFHRFSMVKEK